MAKKKTEKVEENAGPVETVKGNKPEELETIDAATVATERRQRRSRVGRNRQGKRFQ